MKGDEEQDDEEEEDDTDSKDAEKDKGPPTWGTKGEKGTEWAQIIAFCERNGCIADSNQASESSTSAQNNSRNNIGEGQLTKWETDLLSTGRDREHSMSSDASGSGASVTGSGSASGTMEWSDVDEF